MTFQDPVLEEDNLGRRSSRLSRLGSIIPFGFQSRGVQFTPPPEPPAPVESEGVTGVRRLQDEGRGGFDSPSEGTATADSLGQLGRAFDTAVDVGLLGTPAAPKGLIGLGRTITGNVDETDIGFFESIGNTLDGLLGVNETTDRGFESSASPADVSASQAASSQDAPGNVGGSVGGVSGGGTPGDGTGTGGVGTAAGAGAGSSADAPGNTGGGVGGTAGGGGGGGGGGGAGDGGGGAGGAGGGGPGGGAGEGRIICSQLVRMGLMDHEDRMRDLRYTQKHHSAMFIRGYYIWANPVVRALKRGRWTKTWSFIANHRAQQIKYLLGDTENPDNIGRVMRLMVEPISYALGWAFRDRAKEAEIKEILHAPE